MNSRSIRYYRFNLIYIPILETEKYRAQFTIPILETKKYRGQFTIVFLLPDQYGSNLQAPISFTSHDPYKYMKRWTMLTHTPHP